MSRAARPAFAVLAILGGFGTAVGIYLAISITVRLDHQYRGLRDVAVTNCLVNAAQDQRLTVLVAAALAGHVNHRLRRVFGADINPRAIRHRANRCRELLGRIDRE